MWCAIVALACELTAWMQTLAFDRPPELEQGRRWNPSGYDCGCSPSPPEPPAPAAADCCT
jgi:hypothetical protein